MTVARLVSAVVGTALLVAAYTLAAVLVTGPGLQGHLGALVVAGVGFGVGLALLAVAANDRREGG